MSFKALNQARYGPRAAAYVASVTHAQGAELARLVEIAQPQPHWRALDVATGGGHTALRFAPHVTQVVATDLTLAMLEAARAFIAPRAGNVLFSLADAENLPFPRASFDLVTCRIAPHHFPDPWRFVGQCARVLRSGGLLLVQDHVLPDDPQAARYVDSFERLRDPSHVRAFSEAEWRGMFLDHDFIIEHTETLIKRHHLREWAERQGCDAATMERLHVMLLRANPPVQAHMQPEYAGTDYATFADHHLILMGRKPY
ncbi:MAG: methyltransferase domain-containing protein [Anaerolineae bacterium]|nr:methyltransferase domain-containing protein [Anaerolineae bacterium]